MRNCTGIGVLKSRQADFGRSSKPFPNPVRCFGLDILATLTERTRPRGSKMQARLLFRCPGKFEARIESCFATWIKDPGANHDSNLAARTHFLQSTSNTA